MKKLQKGMLIVAILFPLNNRIICQENSHVDEGLYLSSGIGVLDLLNSGLGYYYHNLQGGVRIGSFPADVKLFTLSLDFYYHFGGYSEKAGMNMWYLKMGTQYFGETGEDYYDKMTFFNPRLGRKFFFNKNTGLEIDGGMMILIAENEYYENPPWIDFRMSFFPGLSLSFFYKFRQK